MSRRASRRASCYPGGVGSFIYPLYLSHTEDFIIVSPLCEAALSQVAELPLGNSATNQLSCHDHTFFERLLSMLDDMEPFYDRVLSTEGNIF